MRLTLNILNTVLLLLTLASMGRAGGGGGALMMVICLATLAALNLDSRRSLYWLAIALNGVVVVVGMVVAVALFFGADGSGEGPGVALVLGGFVVLSMILLPAVNIRYIRYHRIGTLAS